MAQHSSARKARATPSAPVLNRSLWPKENAGIAATDVTAGTGKAWIQALQRVKARMPCTVLKNKDSEKRMPQGDKNKAC